MQQQTLFVVFFFALVSSSSASDELLTRSKRLAIHPSRWNLNLWPNGVVPYDIHPHYNSYERAVILSAMNEFHTRTCIRFRPRVASDRYYLEIQKYYPVERCFSYIGRQVVGIFRTREGNIETRMRLDPSCLQFNGKGTVMHELMHILGFYHEHQRVDRDARVGGASGHYNFKYYSRSSAFYMGAYDPTSIMHYNFPGLYYPRSDFSPSDVDRINFLYKCAKNNPTEYQRLNRMYLGRSYNDETVASNSIKRN